VFLPLDLGTEHSREEPGLGGTDFGKAHSDRLDRAVMLDQSAAARGRVCLRHVAVVRQQSSYGSHALCRGRPSELLLKPSSQSGVACFQNRHCPSSALAFHYLVEDLVQGRLVAAGEQGLASRGEPIRKRGRAYAAVLPLVLDKTF
jgi:hypothetical protein